MPKHGEAAVRWRGGKEARWRRSAVRGCAVARQRRSTPRRSAAKPSVKNDGIIQQAQHILVFTMVQVPAGNRLAAAPPASQDSTNATHRAVNGVSHFLKDTTKVQRNLHSAKNNCCPPSAAPPVSVSSRSPPPLRKRKRRHALFLFRPVCNLTLTPKSRSTSRNISLLNIQTISRKCF